MLLDNMLAVTLRLLLFKLPVAVKLPALAETFEAVKPIKKLLPCTAPLDAMMLPLLLTRLPTSVTSGLRSI